MGIENVNRFKAGVSAVAALFTALWGWFGWLVVAWVFCMALDYLTGTMAALKAGEWSSEKARNGLWHKVGAIVAVLVAGILDLVVGQFLGNVVPPGALPFVYTVFLCPLVVVWYIFTEAGSIVENAGKMGSRIPEWLRKAIKALKTGVDNVGDKISGEDKTT